MKSSRTVRRIVRSLFAVLTPFALLLTFAVPAHAAKPEAPTQQSVYTYSHSIRPGQTIYLGCGGDTYVVVTGPSNYRTMSCYYRASYQLAARANVYCVAGCTYINYFSRIRSYDNFVITTFTGN